MSTAENLELLLTQVLTRLSSMEAAFGSLDGRLSFMESQMESVTRHVSAIAPNPSLLLSDSLDNSASNGPLPTPLDPPPAQPARYLLGSNRDKPSSSFKKSTMPPPPSPFGLSPADEPSPVYLPAQQPEAEAEAENDQNRENAMSSRKLSSKPRPKSATARPKSAGGKNTPASMRTFETPENIAR
jgi:hypothetical protein